MRTIFWYLMPRARSFEILREIATNRQLTVLLQRFKYDGFQAGYSRVEPEALAREFDRGGKPTVHLTPISLPEDLEDWVSAAYGNRIMIELGQESADAIAQTTVHLMGQLKDSKAAPAYREIYRCVKSECEDTVLTSDDTAIKLFWHPSISERTLYTTWKNPNSIVRPKR